MAVRCKAERHLHEGLHPRAILSAVDLLKRHVDRDPRALDEVFGALEEPLNHALKGAARGVQGRVNQLTQVLLHMAGKEHRVHRQRS